MYKDREGSRDAPVSSFFPTACFIGLGLAGIMTVQLLPLPRRSGRTKLLKRKILSLKARGTPRLNPWTACGHAPKRAHDYGGRIVRCLVTCSTCRTDFKKRCCHAIGSSRKILIPSELLCRANSPPHGLEIAHSLDLF